MVGRLGLLLLAIAFSKKEGCGITITGSVYEMFCSKARGTMQKYGGE